MMIGKRRLSPSKSVFCDGQVIDTTYENSCARYVVWERRFEKDVEIDPLYSAMGAIDEARFEARLLQQGLTYQREVELSHPIAGTTIKIEGRLDFRVDMPSGPMIVEKKSTISQNRFRTIIQHGNVDEKHLAQVVTYMVIKKIPTAQIVVTFWKWDETIDALTVGGERTFEVLLSPQGDISVDGQPFHKHVRDLQTWYRITAKAMDEADTTLPNRPKAKQSWQNPCKNCPLADACLRYDSTRNVAQFWQDTKSLEPRVGPSALIIAPKVKKGKKNEQNQLPSSRDTINDSGRIRDQTSIDGGEMD
jgi:hypothetical protein